MLPLLVPRAVIKARNHCLMNEKRVNYKFLRYIILTSVAAGFIVWRLWHALAAASGAGPIVDTGVFFAMAKAPFFSKTLLCGLRPPLIPTIYKMLDCNITAIIIFQTFFSSCCWLFLAWSFSRWIHYPQVKIIAFLTIALFSLSTPIVVWESCLISESISIAILATVIGTWMLFMERATKHRAIFLLTTSLAWMLCRETNTWIVLTTVIILLPVALYKRSRLPIIIYSVLFTGFIITNISSNIGKRWLFVTYNIIGTRILTDQDHTAFFQRHGMPLTPALRSMTGICASCNDWAFYRRPDLDDFRQWLYKKGKRTYMLLLAMHPAMTLREPLANISLMLAPGSQFHYASPSARSIMPPVLSKILFPIGYERYFSLVLIWVLVFSTGIAVGAKRWKDNRVWIITIALVLLTYPHIIFVWHGDIVGFEVDRHALAARIQLNCAFWFMVLLTIDRYLQRRNLLIGLVFGRRNTGVLRMGRPASSGSLHQALE